MKIHKPIREPCKECAKYRECHLERRGICTDFEKKSIRTNKDT